MTTYILNKNLNIKKRIYSQTATTHPDASIGACKAPPHENGTRLG